jgi:assimilatory nitrate reductase catalytic subunit
MATQMTGGVQTTTTTHCPFCAYQCGMRMTHDPDASEPEQITPDPEFPVNRGQMCIKGVNAAELLDHPGRLRQPQIRDRSGVLRPVSWATALDELAGRLLTIRNEHGAEAIGVFGSGSLTNEKAYLLGKFARVALQTPNIDYNGRYCMASAANGQNHAFGVDRGLPFPVSDIAAADVVLLWGSNCADTMPPIMQWFDEQHARGGTLIVADPRHSATAERAAIHLQLRPGTDLALANGLLHCAIEEGLVDKEYVDARTVGFDAVRRAVLAYDPTRVERITGVPERQIRQVATLLAKGPASMLLSGRGPEQQSKGTDTVLSFTNLMLALGKVGEPASGYGCLTGQGNGQGGREHGQKADQLPGYRSIVDQADRAAVARVWGIPVESLPGPGRSAYELLDTMGLPGAIHGLLVVGSNIAVASPSARHIGKRLAALECLAVLDAFPNETTEYADIVLPTTQWAEEEGTMTNLEGRVIHRRPHRSPPEGVWSDLQILAALADRLGWGSSFSFAGPREVFDELRRASAGGRADYAGISYERIDEENGVFWPCPTEDHPGTPRLFADRFFHADERAKFVPVEHRAAGEEPDDDYPVIFTTGRYKEHYNSGAQTRAIRRLVEARPEPHLQVHPLLAVQVGLMDDAPVLVESRRGAVVFRTEFNPGIRPDTVFAPFHWGGRQSANILTNPALDPTSRMPEFKLCAVRISAVDEWLEGGAW